MWRAAGTHVAGTSHAKLGIPCQDYCAYRQTLIGAEPALCIAIADGAGSARLSHVGARIAVDHLLQEIPSKVSDIFTANKAIARELLDSARKGLSGAAKEHSVELGDLACTILVAVLGEFASFFVQIGDGAWIYKSNHEYSSATWPSNGEYANETTFLTSPDWQTSISCRTVRGSITAVAGFTDGVQRLALELNTRCVHRPFFEPLFAALQASEDETTLIAPLIDFLTSDRVAERTDDDKTLVLACRKERLLLRNVC